MRVPTLTLWVLISKDDCRARIRLLISGKDSIRKQCSSIINHKAGFESCMALGVKWGL